MLQVSREQITETTLTNLVQAGVIKPDDIEPGRRILDNYPDNDLVMLLTISHRLRELVAEFQPEQLRPFYTITEINLN